MKDTIKLINDKIVKINDALKIISKWKKNNDKIVFTNGCFDILHKGHISYLAKASNLGDKLVIAVNSDSSIKKLNKGSNRPINKENDRLLLLSALQFVDLVFIFNENTPLESILFLKPDILVKGADYNENQYDSTKNDYIVGSNEIRKHGGIVKTITFEEGYSTTSLIKKMKN